MAGLDLTKYHTHTAQSRKNMENTSKSVLNREITLFPARLSDKQKEAMYLELSTMIGAGVDIKAALDLVESEQTKEKHTKILHEIKQKVIHGASLFQAFQESGQFTPYEYYSIQIGEETGKLPLVLQQLASFFSRKLKQRRQFVSALSYPILILLTSFGAVTFMLYFIVPMFSDVFKRFGGELPYLTQIIINLSGWISDYILLLLLAIAGIVVFFIGSKNKVWFQKYSAYILIRIPVFGKIYKGIFMARFCTSMALLIGAKVPLLRAIQLIRQMISFYPIQHSLEQIENEILHGKSLHESLSAYKIYEPRMVALLKVGEEVNQLHTFFEKLTEYYTEQVEHGTSLLSTFLEPLMIIFLGIVVGFILIAMYLPMFQLSTSIGG